jgi:hypothetical protein
MKPLVYLISTILLLGAAVAVTAGEEAVEETLKPVKVRGILNKQEVRYVDKREAGPAERVKVRPSDASAVAGLVPTILHIPNEEVSDAE